MGYSRPDEEFRADHERDHRKHDRPAHRFDRPISTAMDIAVCVRGLKNITDAAALIEQYARMTPDQITAVSRLIVTCEMICESAILSERNELLVRERIASTLAAFGLCASHRDEREVANAQA